MAEKAFGGPVQRVGRPARVTLALAAIGVLTIIGALISRVIFDDTARQRFVRAAGRRESVFLSR